MSNHNSITIPNFGTLVKVKEVGQASRPPYVYYSLLSSSNKPATPSEKYRNDILGNHVKSVTLQNSPDFSETYFVKDSSIPRAKFREYGKSKDWRIVRRQEKSSAIIVPDDFFRCLYTNWYYKYFYLEAQLAKDMITPNTEAYFFATNHCRDVLNIMSREEYNFGDSYIKMAFYGGRISTSVASEINMLKSKYPDKVYLDSYGDYEEEVVNLAANYSDKIVFDDIIASELGESIITLKEYEAISKMMESNQLDNIKLAVSLVTQCNYGKSLLYLALFLYRYNSIVQSENNALYYSKDYKALRKYFDKYGDVLTWKAVNFAIIVKDHKHLVDDDFQQIVDNEIAKLVSSRLAELEPYVNINSLTFNYA